MSINERQKPYKTTREEQDLRWRYAKNEITAEEFHTAYEVLLKQGKIIRSGKVVTE